MDRRGFLEKLVRHGWIINIYLLMYDIVTVNLSYLLALWIRFDCHYRAIPMEYLDPWKDFIPIYTVFSLITFAFLRLYKSIWEYASFDELGRIILASIITSAFHTIAITLFFKRMPITYYAFGMAIQFIMMVAMRFSYRFVRLERGRASKEASKEPRRRVMLIGAGSAGRMILRDMNSTSVSNEKVVCIIDDDPGKKGKRIDGIEVVGGTDKIQQMAKEYAIDTICLAMPSVSAIRKKDILNICKETGCKLINLPGIMQLVTGEVTTQQLKKVDVEDLLGREPVKVDTEGILKSIEGKTIMITGGGGSIGSELARQIASHSPGRLIIFDIYENNAYCIQQELKRKYPDLDLITLIGSVRDSRTVADVFRQYKPEIVYHAAAHKHVPLMEDSPCEAIKNNAIGTYKTAYAAMANGCKKFVLISTDKAVNPTNIMGASKRLCEMVIQTFDSMIKAGKADQLPELFVHENKEEYVKADSETLRNASTEFVAVRFGNVLGSNGSVIPLCKKQIEQGGPVTVTHPDIIRYFMTITEAVSLVLQAGTYARGGEIFVLDMGAPVKIDDLARNLIKLSGLKPDEDIKIEYIGLRPGEKLYEEKLMAEEGLKTTPNKLIHIGLPIPFMAEEFIVQLQELMVASYENVADIRERVAKVVTTYKQ